MSTFDFWNQRFSAEEYVYGDQPNVYLKQELSKLKPGKILLPAEGEGRNAVYAAANGWEVFAFDPSEAGKNKAMRLAESKKVSLNYQIYEVANANYEAEAFDVLALIYAHFHEDKRREYHRKLAGYIKKGGYVVVEAFSKNHTANQIKNPNAGGPKDLEMLYDLTEIRKDFNNFEFLQLEEVVTTLKQGAYHDGRANVIRLLGRKIK